MYNVITLVHAINIIFFLIYFVIGIAFKSRDTVERASKIILLLTSLAFAGNTLFLVKMI